MLGLVVVFLVLDVQNHELVLSLFELTLESGDLLLIGLFALLKFQLEKSQFFHGFFDPLLILAEHAVGSSDLTLKGLVDVFEFDDFALELLELSFELISFPLDELQLLLEGASLRLLLLLA